MSSSSNSVIVITIEVDSKALSKVLSLLLLPDLWPNKLGITKEIPGRTSVMPKDLGNNNNPGFSPLKASRYFDYSAQIIINSTAKAIKMLRSLSTRTKEVFTAGFHELTSQLQAKTSEHLAHRREMPTKLPNPLPQPNVLHKANRR
jgi:hypothetical protein